jgi:hypothetical protein
LNQVVYCVCKGFLICGFINETEWITPLV